MKSYGIDDKVLSWINAFLEGREQVVRVNGELSDSKPVISGIPQGSVLGPFVLYINDLPDTLNLMFYCLQMTPRFSTKSSLKMTHCCCKKILKHLNAGQMNGS